MSPEELNTVMARVRRDNSDTCDARPSPYDIDMLLTALDERNAALRLVATRAYDLSETEVALPRHVMDSVREIAGTDG